MQQARIGPTWPAATELMALTQRLQIRQSQALVMTPQLMQAIKLLQLSNLDLVAYVEAELERNPLLDRGAETEDAAPAKSEGAQAADQPAATGDAPRGNEFEAGAQASDERIVDNRLDDTSPDENESIRPRAADTPAGYSEWAGTSAGGRED